MYLDQILTSKFGKFSSSLPETTIIKWFQHKRASFNTPQFVFWHTISVHSCANWKMTFGIYVAYLFFGFCPRSRVFGFVSWWGRENKPTKIKWRKTRTMNKKQDPTIGKESIVFLLTNTETFQLQESRNKKHNKKKIQRQNWKHGLNQHYTPKAPELQGNQHFCSQAEPKQQTQSNPHKQNKTKETKQTKRRNNKQTKRQWRSRVKWGGPTSPDPTPSRTKTETKKTNKKKKQEGPHFTQNPPK